MTSLHLRTTSVDGCVTISTKQHEDMRGFFVESYNREAFISAHLPIDWPQDNQSNSRENVLRGLHIQRNNPQGKLIRVIKGLIYDVCLDLRPDSPTYLKWHFQVMSGGFSMYCPPGTAHGFLAMKPNSVIYYKCTSLYDKDSDGGINPLDPELGISWPTKDPVMSDKDRTLPTLKEWLKDPRGLSYGNRKA